MLLSSIFPFHRKKISDFSLIFSLCLFILLVSSTGLENSNYDVQRAEIVRKYNGYDCGKQFFTDELVLQALRIASLFKGEYRARPYDGLLYDKSLGYLRWPIALDEGSFELKRTPPSKIWHVTTYQVVFTKNNEVIDLLVMLTNHDLAKCSRIDHSKLEAQYQDIENSTGYYCGVRFIPKDHIEDSALFARKFLGEQKKFPAPYTGHLYRNHHGYLIWPIYRGQKLKQTPNFPAGPYFIVIDPEGQIKDVIAQTNDNSHVKCVISINTLPEFASNVENDANMMSTTGFDCHGVFFDDEHLQIAKNMAYKSWTSKKTRTFPTKYDGPPFETSCLLWPIKAPENSIRNGYTARYRLVLSLDFEVMSVIIKSSYSHLMERCERKTVLGGITGHDPNDYKCSSTIFRNSELLTVAKIACEKRSIKTYSYPRSFHGASFVVPGPYFIYPIVKGKDFHSMMIGPGSNYMVMNNKCMLAGAITMNRLSKQVRKCEVSISAEGPELDGSIDI